MAGNESEDLGISSGSPRNPYLTDREPDWFSPTLATSLSQIPESCGDWSSSWPALPLHLHPGASGPKAHSRHHTEVDSFALFREEVTSHRALKCVRAAGSKSRRGPALFFWGGVPCHWSSRQQGKEVRVSGLNWGGSLATHSDPHTEGRVCMWEGVRLVSQRAACHLFTVCASKPTPCISDTPHCSSFVWISPLIYEQLRTHSPARGCPGLRVHTTTAVKSSESPQLPLGRGV